VKSAKKQFISASQFVKNTMKIAVIYFELFLLTFTFICCLSAPTAADEKNKIYWYNQNYESIKRKISYFNLKPENLVQVKNVILFVGDGMGLTTVTASRVLKQQKSRNPDATRLVFDEFPASAFIKTDTSNSQISESAAAATALFCGVKTNLENLGVDSSAGKDACNNIESHTPSIISWAQNKNLKTGLVSFHS
jgi:alkaline phosphatase